MHAVLEQDLPRSRYEIIVVDDGRSPTTAPLIASVVCHYPGAQVSLRRGAGRGPAAARNRGWRAARGEVIAFIDDDAYPGDCRWLREGCRPFADAAVVGVCGAVRVPADTPPTDYQRNVKSLERGGFITCNAFYRRSVLAEVDGFDERFTVPYREDSDLHFRVEATGGRLLTNPAAVVIHPAPAGPFAVSLRLQRNSMFNALIYKKHPRRYREELQRFPPVGYYAMTGLAAGAGLAALSRRPRLALACLGPWALLEARFFLRRARGTSHRPTHLFDLALTSLLIPPLSVYWRLQGAIRFRVLFL